MRARIDASGGVGARAGMGAVSVGVLALFGALGLSFTPSSSRSETRRFAVASRSGLPPGRPPAPEPLQFRQVTADDARTINAVMPFSGEPNPQARPFAARFAGTMDEARALDCLTAAVYYEAAVEAPDGQRAVAQVVLNRLRHPAYPKTVCGVVFQGQERRTGCQFTFTCDGAMTRPPNMALWTRARAIAWAALSGQVFAPVGWATHYHTDWVVPYWASSLAKASKVGTHIFYRWLGGWGRAPAFTGRYAGVEPSVGKLAALSGAHGDAPVDVAVASDAALDALAAADGIVVEGGGAERVTMQLNVAAAQAPGTVPVAGPAETKVPWELRWALTGAGPNEPEAALGPAAAAKTASAAKTTAAPKAQPAARTVPVTKTATPAIPTPAPPAMADCSDRPAKTKVAVPTAGSGFGEGATITVRETCGA